MHKSVHLDPEKNLSEQNDPGISRAGATPRYWKSFGELAGTDEAKLSADDEFPDREGLASIDRRDFLKVTGAGLALAGLAAGCRPIPQTKAVPYVRAPQDLIPGKALSYATALCRNGYATGVLVTSHEGRPTKIEGNPRHPSSLGRTDIWTQAEILSLYDPERSQSVLERGEISSWDQFLSAVRPVLMAQAATGGAGIRLVTNSVTSPTLIARMQSFLAKYPAAKIISYEPIGRDYVYEGARLAFGQAVNPVYKLDGAKTILALDADFLLSMPGNVRYASEFADGRRVRKEKPEMNRLYAIESAYTITGASADHRVSVKPSEVEAVARALYARLSSGAGEAPKSVAPLLDALIADLRAGGVVIAGDQVSPATHALVHAINASLGAAGRFVTYTTPAEMSTESGAAQMAALVDDMKSGKVALLGFLGANPVYDAPADLGFADAMMAQEAGRERVPMRFRLGHYEDETSELCHWHLPESHALETWGDAVGYDGTVSVVQPLIYPLYGSKSVLETVSNLLDSPVASLELVQTQHNLTGDAWRTALHAGVIDGTGAKPVTVAVRAGAIDSLPAAPASTGIELDFRPDPTIWDGRYANNSWLQELPKPITTIVWDNVAVISPSTAKELGVLPRNGESDAVNIAQYSGKRMVSIGVGGKSVSLPVWVLPGQPDNVVTLTLGYGRVRCGEVGTARGFSVYPLRRAATPTFVGGAKVEAVDETYKLVYTQPHHLMRAEYQESENRDIVRSGTLEEFVANGGSVHEEEHEHDYRVGDVAGEVHAEGGAEGEAHEGPIAQGDEYAADPSGVWKYTQRSEVNKQGLNTLYPEFSNRGYNAWAMSIDLTTCIGCNACTIACQAENNIPTVGKEQVGRGREMHWIRIDHYYGGVELDDTVKSHFMPVPCMQCEKAPCEPVCPVAATIHSHEGLNQMVYNRCIGTRYCSNNCPYKVRRFNFLKWTQGVGGPGTLDFYNKPQLQMLANPNVSVRGRGVMEKCTYCVQRINEVRIEAKKEQREIQDGEIITACQQVCPTNAIIFGDIHNPNSKVSLLKTEHHDYALLADLNTRPRTTYLAKVRNPNPQVEKA